MAFNFGSGTSAPSTFGGFGSTAKTTSSSLFGGGFGAKSTVGFGGFGAKTTAAASPFNFATSNASSSSSLFPSFGTKTMGFGTGTTGFGTGTSGFGTGTTSFGGFGATSSAGFGSANTALFSGFGAKSTAATGFGFASQPTFTMGQQQQQQQASIVENPLATMTSAVTMPTLFGDERDVVVAKLNQLQALWGYGKAFYSSNAQPITFSPENPFCRFKSIGYSCLPSAKDSDGFVSLDLSHKEEYVKQNQQQFVESIHKILGGSPTLSVCVDGVRGLPGDKSEVIIFVVERQSNGSTRCILATELYAVFSQDNIKKQLQTLGVENMVAKTTLNDSQLKQFLDNPPLGVDSILWEQAKKDNPDSKRLIPVPMMGFNELHTRLKHQKYQNAFHQKRLDLISDEISQLQTAHSTTVAKIAQYKRKHLELEQRTLQVLINQESVRKTDYAIEPHEEQLRVQLESLHAAINAPMQFQTRLNEIMSQTRLQSQFHANQTTVSYDLDDSLKAEIKQHLTNQQTGLLNLISIIKEDFEDLKIIESGIQDGAYIHRR